MIPFLNNSLSITPSSILFSNSSSFIANSSFNLSISFLSSGISFSSISLLFAFNFSCSFCFLSKFFLRRKWLLPLQTILIISNYVHTGDHLRGIEDACKFWVTSTVRFLLSKRNSSLNDSFCLTNRWNFSESRELPKCLIIYQDITEIC